MGRVKIERHRGSHIAAAVLVAVLVVAPLWAADAGPAGDAHAAPAPTQAKESVGEQEEKSSLEHVVDSWEIELFESFGPSAIHLPYKEFDIAGHQVRIGLSKFMLLELLAAVLVILFYLPLAYRLRSGDMPTGWHQNVREVLLTFVRDEVAKPSIGHDADRFVPFLWTLFLFILFNNLLGMLPFCGSATSSLYVTAGLALCVFFAIHGWGMVKLGTWHYITSMWPHIDVPFGLGYVLKPLIFFLEWLGVLVRNAVLAVRLFANMFAGHVVLATILIFIYTAGHLPWGLWGTISVLSVLGQVALSLLEIFVAFLQAYIFTFLTAIFMGMAMHPAH